MPADCPKARGGPPPERPTVHPAATGKRPAPRAPGTSHPPPRRTIAPGKQSPPAAPTAAPAPPATNPKSSAPPPAAALPARTGPPSPIQSPEVGDRRSEVVSKLPAL